MRNKQKKSDLKWKAEVQQVIWSSGLTSWLLFPKVLNVSLLEGEQVTVEDTGGREPFILANETVLMKGLVLRSWSNQISIRFRRDQEDKFGSIQLHYQGEPVGCDVLVCRQVIFNFSPD